MSDPIIAGNATEFQKVAKAAAELDDQVSAYDLYKATQIALKEAKELLKDSDGALPLPFHTRNYVTELLLLSTSSTLARTSASVECVL